MNRRGFIGSVVGGSVAAIAATKSAMPKSMVHIDGERVYRKIQYNGIDITHDPYGLVASGVDNEGYAWFQIYGDYKPIGRIS